ncbi:hypothetical protein HHK36_014482 [Tetracentron sinense]|uniref:Cation-transporting P-type ATPase N-terminal domain-containing protein n=1 Tax=Tetracentron sinense TaxID=13715 RepID=A0A835DEA4_TETSI|nr:hypothetical protein HHK36_014482 [Tetracentron sinense]
MADDLEEPLLNPENFSRDGIDLERLPLEEVFEQLKTSLGGLSAGDAEVRLQIFGPNKLEEKPENKFLKFLSFMWNPLSWVMEAAAVMAIALANGGGEGPDWQDFVGIVCLLIINSTISFIEENNAGNAAAALMAHLAPKTKDFPVQSALTGESLAVTKRTGDEVFSGSTCKHGEIEAVVIATGAHSFFGKAAHLVDSTEVVGHFQKWVCWFLSRATAIASSKRVELVIREDGGYGGMVRPDVGFGKRKELNSPRAKLIAGGGGRSSAHKVLWGLSFDGVDGEAVLTSIGNFCICSIAVGMIFEIIVMFPIQHRSYRNGINNLLVLLIGGIPIAMPTVLSVTLAIGSHRLSQQGAITKRMTAIEEMAGMDVLCSDKTGTLTLNRLTVDRNLIEVFNKDIDKDTIVLLAARASRLENQDAIDTAIVNMLADPKEARANITEVHFLPFNPVEKRTAITYIDYDGNWYRASKGAPEQILNLCQEKEEIAGKVHAIIDKFAERGLRSLGVAYQGVPEKSKESPGGPWTFCGLLPLFDPPRHDSAETIRTSLSLGVCVKMITGM